MGQSHRHIQPIDNGCYPLLIVLEKRKLPLLRVYIRKF